MPAQSKYNSRSSDSNEFDVLLFFCVTRVKETSECYWWFRSFMPIAFTYSQKTPVMLQINRKQI